MKYIFPIFLAIVFLTSCFSTKSNDEEELRAKRLKDSLHRDSMSLKWNTPDTALATFRRFLVCDKKRYIVFDRVVVLSGTEAMEYALRHKRFGNNLNVVVNDAVKLETLPLWDTADVFLLKPNPQMPDSVEAMIPTKVSALEVDGSLANHLVEIVVLQRQIIYLREVKNKDE